jgi:hypothetical protein
MTEPKNQTHTDEELKDIDELWVRTQAKRDREIPPADAETAAAYARHYDNDLRVFIHQLCEISSIIGSPYDAHFNLSDGRFEWWKARAMLSEPAVVLSAGPGRRSRLTVATGLFSESTLDALCDFCERCKIRFQIAANVEKQPNA